MDTEFTLLFTIGEALRTLADSLADLSRAADVELSDALVLDASQLRSLSRELLNWTDRQALERGCFHPRANRLERPSPRGGTMLVCRGCQAALCGSCGQAVANTPATRPAR